MTTIRANIPDFLASQSADAAKKEETTVDHLIARALSAQLSVWNVRDTVLQRATSSWRRKILNQL